MEANTTNDPSNPPTMPANSSQPTAIPMGGAIWAPRGIFQNLQLKLDEDSAIKDDLRNLVQQLEKLNRQTQSCLSTIHSTPRDQLMPVLQTSSTSIREEIAVIKQLDAYMNKHPFYKFHHAWTRQVQDTTYAILLLSYLDKESLLTIEEVGQEIGIPVNVKGQDVFHLTVEEYLFAVISLVEEVSRLARNSVTLGDHALPVKISRFVKDVHAGFQILNLKNDALRKRSDGLKYRVKDVEDVVYDLSLRGLVSRNGAGG